MCRLLGYLGSSIQLDRILIKPEHSLIVQSYKPEEMTSGLLNADGFGVGWYDLSHDPLPYSYKNTLPIWNDSNLSQLARYVKSECHLCYVRSATDSSSVAMINCQPFSYQNILFVHNGFIDDFRSTLCRPIREQLSDIAYRNLSGTTDSEHIFALIVNEIEADNSITLIEALKNTIVNLADLAKQYNLKFSANIILSNGRELAACRYANRQQCPSLYYIKDNSEYSDAVIITSEPMFEGDWISCPEQSLIGVGENLEVSLSSIS
jgi:glutamine amidotransferase